MSALAELFASVKTADQHENPDIYQNAHGSWTSGHHNTRTEAEEIIAGSPATPKPRLARRWISDWQPEEAEHA